MNRRVRVVLVPFDSLGALLLSRQLHMIHDLPKDAEVVRVYPDVRTEAVCLYVSHESFDEVPQGEQPPELHVRYQFDPAPLPEPELTPQMRDGYEWVKVKSSNIAEVGYNAEASSLQVRFTNGSLYGYADVPRRTFDAFITSPSPGGYFHQNIRHGFSTVKYEDAKEG